MEQEWIEAPDGWGPSEEKDSNDVVDLFGNDDPSEHFAFDIKVDGATVKKIRLHGFKLDSDETSRSTGVTLWQAAPRLAEYLQVQPDLCKGKSVLELGAGLGLCGITAHYLGAAVTMTDGDTHALQKLRENVRQNCNDDDDGGGEGGDSQVACRQLLWGSPYMEQFLEQHGKFDTVIGADVIYTKDSILPLFDTVAFLLNKPNGRFVLSRHNKWNNVENEVIFEAAKQRGMTVEPKSEGIYIFHWDESEAGGTD